MVELFYLVTIKTRTKTEKPRFFVCTKNRRDEFNIPSAFHGVGYWHEGSEGIFEDVESRNEEEVWISWNQISYVKSLLYRPR